MIGALAVIQASKKPVSSFELENSVSSLGFRVNGSSYRAGDPYFTFRFQPVEVIRDGLPCQNRLRTGVPARAARVGWWMRVVDLELESPSVTQFNRPLPQAVLTLEQALGCLISAS